jgi:predicted nucleic acid-binding protein
MSCTFDTNVLVYTLVKPPAVKGERARELFARCTHDSVVAVLLFQVLAEFSHVAMRKFAVGAAEVHRRLNIWRRIIPIHAAGDGDLDLALRLVSTHRLGFWDALICATAVGAGLDYLLSEDMQDGRRFGDLTIVNPFRPENAGLIDHILPP